MVRKGLLGIMEGVLNYIEENLTHKITLEQLSQHSHLSKFHLHRLLRHTLDKPVMDYIRARKITSSLDVLLDPAMTVLRIGLMFGFEHEQSYIRAFKRELGTTPANFRKRPVGVALTERADLSHITIMEDGLLFKPVTRFTSERLVVGKLFEIDLAENLRSYTANLAGNEFYYQVHPRIRHKVNETQYIGLTRYHWAGNIFTTTYLPSVQVTSAEDLAHDLTADRIPGSKYAVYTYIGGFHPRQLTINHLEQIWSSIRDGKDHYLQSEPFHFEVINEAMATEEHCEVDIYIPIHTKTASDYEF